MVCVNLILKGHVQGVGLRAEIKEKAKELRLEGYVMNLEDGSVKIIAQGKKDKVDKLIEICLLSPGTTYVEDLEIEYSDTEIDTEGFEIRSIED